MDQVARVIMTDQGQIGANPVLKGILDKKRAVEEVKEFPVYRPRVRLIKAQPKGPEETVIAK